ncbi:MAG: hypothetical protein FWC65_05755 [Treponema sp.]|nr:hypothetical protein [Treponema sp.]
MRRILCLAALIFFPFLALQAQSRVIPLALILEAAEFAASSGGIWQPNWPLELPPDAFRVAAGAISAITLEGENLRLRLSYNEAGKLGEFPFMANGRMAQVSLNSHEGEIREIALRFPPDEAVWEFEFLEHRGYYFSLVRVSAGGEWYFITLSRWARGITETWFDAEGNVLAAYAFSLAEFGSDMRIRSVLDLLNPAGQGAEYFYDSWGQLTQVAGADGFYSVLHYRDALPRYWDRRPAGGGSGADQFYLQWDAGGFLVRKTRGGAEAGAQAADEYRFEYDLDEKGNWTQRRAIRMVERGGLLFPAPGAVFTRVLEYRQP